jgi:hypothetical protein
MKTLIVYVLAFFTIGWGCTAPGSLDTSLRDHPAIFKMRFLRHNRSIIR